jgi:hypothetical protein
MAVVLLAVAAAACAEGDSRTVEVVGDSLTYQSNESADGQAALLVALEQEGYAPSGGGIPGMTVESAYGTMWSKGSSDVLVGVNEATQAWQLHEHGPAYNDMLRELADEHGEAHVVDWEPEPEMIAGDGIHLTEEGRVAYRDLIVDGVGRC